MRRSASRGAIDLNDELNAEVVIARHLWRNHRLLPPSSASKRRWDIMILLFVFYSSVVYPMTPAFRLTPDGAQARARFRNTRRARNSAQFSADARHARQAVFEALMDVCFWLDIAINFRTAYYAGEFGDELVSEWRKIARRYACSRFGCSGVRFSGAAH